VQASTAEVAESLRGNWRDEMLFELSQARESYRFAQQQIQSCDRKLESYLKVLPTRQVEIMLPARRCHRRPHRSGRGKPLASKEILRKSLGCAMSWYASAAWI